MLEKTKEELKRIINQQIEVEKYVSQKEIIGKCPICGNNIYENQKSFYCSNYKEGCKANIWKESDYFKQPLKVTKEKVKKLLKGQKIKFRLKSLKGSEYEPEFLLQVQGDYLRLQKGDYVKKK